MSSQTNLMLDPTEGTQTPKTGTDLELACRRCIEAPGSMSVDDPCNLGAEARNPTYQDDQQHHGEGPLKLRFLLREHLRAAALQVMQS